LITDDVVLLAALSVHITMHRPAKLIMSAEPTSSTPMAVHG
jgi:hypothetical protein